MKLSEEEKTVWKKWEVWDKLRFERDCSTYESKPSQKSLSDDASGNESKQEEFLVTSPKQELTSKKSPESTFHIPKKKKRLS